MIIKVYRKLRQLLGIKDYFAGSINYWESRYTAGGNSGSGSYNRLAEFKAEVLNQFIQENNIQTAIEFGVGDGNQLTLLKVPFYIGLDVAPAAIGLCTKRFHNDPTKSFYLYNPLAFSDHHKLFKAEVSMSLDVIYHIVEDKIFNEYMSQLFDAGTKFVIVYASNFSSNQKFHEKERRFTDWIEKYKPESKLMKMIPNKYPYVESDQDNTSQADFYIYQK
jgi:hypothetical protein